VLMRMVHTERRHATDPDSYRACAVGQTAPHNSARSHEQPRLYRRIEQTKRSCAPFTFCRTIGTAGPRLRRPGRAARSLKPCYGRSRHTADRPPSSCPPPLSNHRFVFPKDAIVSCLTRKVRGTISRFRTPLRNSRAKNCEQSQKLELSDRDRRALQVAPLK
jgi:hypothetical protein